MRGFSRLIVVAICTFSLQAGCIRTADQVGVPMNGPADELALDPESMPRPAKVREWNWLELETPFVQYIPVVAFSSDDSMVAAGSGDTIWVWSTGSGKQVTRMKLPEKQNASYLSFSGDGRTLVSDCSEDPMIRYWDVKTGKQKRELPHDKPPDPDGRFNSGFKAFGPGASFVVYAAPHEKTWAIKMMHLEDGKVDVVMGTVPRSEIAFSPDGKTMAMNGPNSQLRLFDSRMKQIKELRPPFKEPYGATPYYSVRFSPDGRYVIAQEDAGRNDPFAYYRFVIWGVEDGRKYWSKEKRGGWISAGNRYVIVDDRLVIDLLTDEEVAVKNPLSQPHVHTRLAGMSSDGKLLAFIGPKSGGPQAGQGQSVYLTPALVLPEPLHHAERDLSAQELEAAWSGAVSENLFRRNHCIKTLTAHPHQAIQIAESKVKPVSKTEMDRIADLIKRLDDDDPDVRDKTTIDIEGLAHRFEPILAAALKAAEPGEVRNRLTAILRKTAERDWPPELKAELQAITFLEEFGTTESRRLLERLAKGASGTRPAEAAVTALKRLEKSPK